MTKLLLKTLLAAGIGFMFGGPFGAIVSAAISTIIFSVQFYFFEDESSEIRQNRIIKQTAVLLTLIAKSDKSLQPTEARFIGDIFKTHFHCKEKQLSLVRNTMKETLRNDIAPDVAAKRFKRIAKYEESLWLVTLLWKVATVDGAINYAELDTISVIARGLGISKSQQDKITEEFMNPTMQKYSVLGISPNASVGLIRDAYKKMAVDNHPDKFIHMGDNHVRLASDKFAQITEAYKAIKKERGF
jgi:DnaJ like chaperone protein